MHFYLLSLDGAYVGAEGKPFFRWVKPPTAAEIGKRIHQIGHRAGRYPEGVRLLMRDMENSDLTF